MRNQYFQLVFKNNRAFLHIFPPLEGGESLNIGEVTAYLDSRKYQNYNIKELNQALKQEEETEVLLGPWDGIEVSESMDINIDMDKMTAICRFYPPSPGGRLMDAREIVGSLTYNKVRHGADQQAIFNFLEDRKYCTDYVFAKGTPPIHGTDARIEYYFNTDRNLQPKRNADGSVDYKELNTISHVKAGQLLARLFKEDHGTPGRNIYGEEIKPRSVNSAKLGYGKNISINEEQTEIYSDVTGHANYINGKVFVSDVFEVPADVDNSIGNIVYEGSVLIHGNVKTGFSVRASVDVIVEGVVEGAYIEAGGQIIIKHGIHGMFKGEFHAGTNLMAKYIENATVHVGGYVEAEIILNSEVNAVGCVRSMGKKGRINGGVIRAKNSIEADNIGTEMGTATMLEVGMEPAKKERYILLGKEIGEKEKELEDNQVIINTYRDRIKKGDRIPKDKMQYLQTLLNSYKELQSEIENLKKEYGGLHDEMMASEKSYIVVRKTIYPGVSIAISDLNYHVKDVRNCCKFKKQEGEIRPVNI